MMKKKLLLTLVCALMGVMSALAAEGYAVFNVNNKTLTFYYGNKPEGAYSLNEGSAIPLWYEAGNSSVITRVVFDPSFAQARPTSTYCWFYKMENLTTITGLNYLNTSEVTTMEMMFRDCKELTNLDVSHFNTSKVTNMHRMFTNCNKLTALDLSHFNTSKVTNMYSIFENCQKLTSLNLSGFNTSKLNVMEYMFMNCSSLTNLDLSSFNTSNVTSMYGMFWGCNNLKTLDLSGFNTLNVTDMKYMFISCKNLTSLNLSNLNTSNVTNMEFMFAHCDSLTYLDLRHFNTAKVNYMNSMFQDCSNLETVIVGDTWTTAAVTNSLNMFALCKSIVGGAGTTYDYNHLDKEYAHIDGGPSNPGYFTAKGNLRGDVNGDGKVNVSDVSTLINMILGLSPMNKTRADVNGDTKVNVSDVTALINIILGIH